MTVLNHGTVIEGEFLSYTGREYCFLIDFLECQLELSFVVNSFSYVIRMNKDLFI